MENLEKKLENVKMLADIGHKLISIRNMQEYNSQNYKALTEVINQVIELIGKL